MKTDQAIKDKLFEVQRAKMDQYHPMEWALYDKAYAEALRWVLE